MAARLLQSVLAGTPNQPTTAPGLTERILDAVRSDRRARQRRSRFAMAGGLAIAAAVVLVVWLRWTPDTGPMPDVANLNRDPRIEAITPPPRTIRIGDELSKVGNALLDAPRTITASTADAPDVIAKLTSALTRVPPAIEIESPRSAIAEIPYLARTGLEPVTNTAQQAFTRLLSDIGTVQIGPKPKS